MALTDTRQSRYIDSNRLKDFRGFGGIRLEDDVWITPDGCVNLTQCPRAIDEVLHVMKGGAWPREMIQFFIYSNVYIYIYIYSKSNIRPLFDL